MDRHAFAALIGTEITAQSHDMLAQYVAELLRWNHAINLVSRGDEEDMWRRHIADSARLLALAPPGAQRWLDLGSGGGLPAIVVAVLAAQDRPQMTVAMVESDRRKASFLRKVMQDLGLSGNVYSERAETLAPQSAYVVSARALAPLPGLVPMALRHLAPDGVMLFPKGRQFQQEVDALASKWRFDLEVHRALAISDTPVLALRNIVAVQEVGI